MLQVAVSVFASLVLVGLLTHSMNGDDIRVVKTPPPSTSIYEVAGDGVNVQLPSSGATPKSTFGTPIAGASKMPSATSYTHTMFDQ